MEPTIDLVTGAGMASCGPDAVCSPQDGPSECMPDSDPYPSGDDEDD